MELWIYAKRRGGPPSPARTKLDPSDVYPQKSGFQETTGIFGRNLPEPKKKLLNSDIDHLLFEDETMIRDYQAIGCTWFLRGHQRKIPTYGQHKGVKLIGTLDYETGRIICTEEGAYDAAAFLRFLERTLREYPTGKIVMVLDNALIHHAKLIQSFLEENARRLALIFLPPYRPQLNLMEGVWK